MDLKPSFKNMSPKEFGAMSECIFEVEARKRGFAVFKPSGDNLPQDCIVCNPKNELFKVQIKSVRPSSPDKPIKVYLKRSPGRRSVPYTGEEVDIFAVVIPDFDAIYLIPFAEKLREFSPEPWSKKSPSSKFLDNWVVFEEEIKKPAAKKQRVSKKVTPKVLRPPVGPQPHLE